MKQRHRQPVRGTDRHKYGTCAGVHPHLTGTNGTHTSRCVPCAGGAMGFKSLSLTPDT
jgi:hypothetical protein